MTIVLHFIIGTDLIPTLHTWHEGDKLIEETPFVVFPRSGHPVDFSDPNEKNIPKNSTIVPEECSLIGMISSTEVTVRIKQARLLHE